MSPTVLHVGIGVCPLNLHRAPGGAGGRFETVLDSLDEFLELAKVGVSDAN